ncbi:MAG: hypothetical protein F6K19_43090 [Cyanothece sp. SIO1E1]|nr:hypothetical protein [Cyanothece sp. SIO1E1]
MVKLKKYRKTVQKLLQDYAAFSRDAQDINTELICDTIGSFNSVS